MPLAPISDPAFVIPAIVQTLGLQASGATPPLDLLKSYLKEKQMLLLLDNFEQVIAAAPAIAEILAAAPQVNILVTSRTVLRISGEHNYPVPALDLPDFHRERTVRKLSQYEAVRLFIERACAAKPDFVVTNANAPAVAEICVRLDGLPLAIELAATRVRLLPPHKMLPQLEHRLKFLTGGARDVPARQQALRNTIEWSYQLLTDAEKTLFRRLAVFVGGCSFEAIEAVCASDQKSDIFSGVESLVDKSLLKQVETDAEPRFVMLETIREYALERLAESGEEEAIRRQHAQFFLTVAEAAEPQMYLVEQQKRLDRDHPNFRGALAWSLNNAVEIGVRLAAALGDFWFNRAYYAERRDWLTKALAHSQAYVPHLDRYRAKTPEKAGAIAYFVGEFTVAFGLLKESEALYRALDDPAGLAQVFRWLGICIRYSSFDFASTRVLLEKSLDLCRRIDDIPLLVKILDNYVNVLEVLGDDEHAELVAKEGLALAQSINDLSAIVNATRRLGAIALTRNEYKTAQALFEKCLKLSRDIASKVDIGFSLLSLGEVFYAQEQDERALTYYTDALKIFQEINIEWVRLVLEGAGHVLLRQQRWHEAYIHFVNSLKVFRGREHAWGRVSLLTGLAGVAEEQGQSKRTAQLLGVTERFQADPHGWIDSIFQPEYERITASVRRTLGEEAFEKAFAKGREMTLEQAIALALEGQGAYPDKKS